MLAQGNCMPMWSQPSTVRGPSAGIGIHSKTERLKNELVARMRTLDHEHAGGTFVTLPTSPPGMARWKTVRS